MEFAGDAARATAFVMFDVTRGDTEKRKSCVTALAATVFYK